MVVSSVSITEATDDAVVATFVLSAENPGDEALLLKSATYDVSVAGVRTSVRRSPEASLRATGGQQIILPVALKMDRAARAAAGSAAAYSISGSLAYLSPGVVAQQMEEWGIYAPSASFAGSGTINLTAAPSPAPKPEGYNGLKRLAATNSGASGSSPKP